MIGLSGLFAVGLLTVSAGIGLLSATPAVIKSRWRGRWLTVHRIVSVAGLVAIAVHSVALIGSFQPDVLHVLVPFLSDFETPWVAAGTIGGWGVAIFGLSYFARSWIGRVRWRRIHRWALAAWILCVVHAVSLGGGPWPTILGVAFVLVLALFALRWSPWAKPRRESTAASA